MFPPNAWRGERRGVWGRAAPITLVFALLHILFRRAIAKRAVRPTRVVLDPVLLDDHSRLRQAAKDLPVQAFVPQLIVEALDVAVLPGRPGLDVDRPDPLRLYPVAVLTALEVVLGEGLEPSRLAAYAPQTYVSAISPPEREWSGNMRIRALRFKKTLLKKIEPTRVDRF